MADLTIIPAAILSLLASFLSLPASADVALVADLDSDATNGSGTLQTGSTDTVFVGGGDEGAPPSEPTSFSRVLVVPDEDVLFIHGERKTGELECTWSVGGPLVIDGHQILPGEPVILPGYGDSALAQEFGGIPFVRGEQRLGTTWREAVLGWELRKGVISGRVANAYRLAWSATQSDSLSRGAAQDTLDALNDTLVVEPAGNLEWRDGNIYFPWRGVSLESQSPFLESQWKAYRGFRLIDYNPAPSYSRAVGYVRTIAETLDRFGPSLVIVARNGDRQTFVAPRMTAEEFRAAYLQQILDSRPGDLREGFIHEIPLAEIVEKEGLDQ